MELHIKNMVCGRCIKVVATILKQEGLQPESVRLGVVNLKDDLTREQRQKIEAVLEAEGFALLDDQKAKLVDEIKRIIIALVHYEDLEQMNEKLSGYLSGKLHKDYHY